MSFTVSHFTNNDGVYAKLTNVANTYTTFDIQVTDTADSTDTYASSEGLDKTTGHSGVLAKSFVTNGGATQVFLVGAGNTGSDDGSFKLVSGTDYKMKAVAKENGVGVAFSTVNFTHTSPPSPSDFTPSIGTNSNSIQFGTSATLDTGIITAYHVSVSGPVVKAGVAQTDAQQKHWGKYISVSSANGSLTSAALATQLAEGSTTSEGFVDLNEAGHGAVDGSAGPYTNGTHDVTVASSTGSGADAKIRFVVAEGVVTKMFPLVGGSGYAASEVLTFNVPNDGGTAALTYTIPATGVITGSNTQIIAEGGGLTAGDQYDMVVVAIGNGGSSLNSVTYKAIPNTLANGVTVSAATSGISLNAAPYSVGASADWDRTIGINFTKGVQMANEYLDKFYIVSLSANGTTKYRKFKNPAWTGSAPAGSAFSDNGNYALAGVDGSSTDADLYVKIDENALFVGSATGDSTSETPAALGSFLVDGTEYTIDVKSGNVNNEASNPVQGSDATNGTAEKGTPSSVPEDVVGSSASSPGMMLTVGKALGTSYGLTSANWGGRIRIGIKVVDPNDSNATLNNGSAITKVKFNISTSGNAADAREITVTHAAEDGNGNIATNFVGTGNDFRYHDITEYNDGNGAANLADGTTYLITDMQFVNANGNGADTDSSMSAVPSTLPGAPGDTANSNPVQNAKATNTTNTEVQAKWSAAAANGSSITKYTLQHGSSAGFESGTYTTIVDIDAGDTDATITGLDTGVVRYVRVRAHNDNDEGPWVVLTGAGGFDEFVPSGIPGFGISSGNKLTHSQVAGGSALNLFSFITNFSDATLSDIHNNGYPITGVRIYFGVQGTANYAAFDANPTAYFLDIPKANFHAMAGLAEADFVRVAAGAVTAGAPTVAWIANTAAYRYKAFMYPYNAVYGTALDNAGAELPAVYPYYTSQSSFSTAPAASTAAATDVTISWAVTSGDSVAPFKKIDYVLAEDYAAERASAGGEITYAGDYTNLAAGAVTNLGTDTTATSLTLSTTSMAPIRYGWKYKFTASVESYANQVMWDAGNEVAGTQDTAAASIDNVIPKNKPGIDAPGISGNDMEVKINANGTALGDTFLLSPAGNNTSVISLTDGLKVANNKYAGGLPPFNEYVTYNANGLVRTAVTDIDLKDTVTVGDTSNYLIVSEAQTGAAIRLAGTPLTLTTA